MRERIRHIIIKLMNNDDLYVNRSPRISLSEINEIECLVNSTIQTEYIHGAESGSPRMAYPLRLDEFREKVKILLEKKEAED